jgi:hypothetical protein
VIGECGGDAGGSWDIDGGVEVEVEELERGCWAKILGMW